VSYVLVFILGAACGVFFMAIIAGGDVP